MAGRDERAARPNDRAATEAALQDAALRLLERHGVLAGLNLQHVADEAGVNRGLVYHYFGSRQALLRAALQRDVDRRVREVAEARPLPLPQRVRAFLRTVVRHRRAVELTSLLVLDHDPSLRLIRRREQTLARFEEDAATGDLDDVDLEALLVVVNAFGYGYALYRQQFARDLGIGVRELDERVGSLVERTMRGLAPRPSSARSGISSQ